MLAGSLPITIAARHNETIHGIPPRQSFTKFYAHCTHNIPHNVALTELNGEINWRTTHCTFFHRKYALVHTKTNAISHTNAILGRPTVKRGRESSDYHNFGWTGYEKIYQFLPQLLLCNFLTDCIEAKRRNIFFN